MRCAVLALVAACGGGIAFDDFAGEQRGASCGYYVRCGAFGTVADCRLYYERFDLDNPSLEAAVDAGKIHYDSSAAANCIDALDSLACDLADQDANALAACDDVLTGTRKIGAACAFDAECVTERCVIPDCTDACCQGTCEEPRVLPGVGEPCSSFCADDLYCGFDQKCHVPLPEGAQCNTYEICAEPLYCSYNSRTCRVRPARGEPCDGTCATEGDVCGSDGHCVQAATGGDPCITGADCSKFYICNIDMARCTIPESRAASPNGTCDAVCSDVPICF